MAVDINAIYNAGPAQPIDLGAIYGAAARIAQFKRQIAAQNALKAMFSNPQNLGPNGMPNQNAMRLLLAVDPQAGMAMMENEARIGEQRAMTAEHQQKETLVRDNYLNNNVRKVSADAYEQAVSEGKTPEQAQDIAQKVYTDGLNEARRSGLFSDDEAAQFDPKFDINRVQQRIKLNAGAQGPRKGTDIETMTDALGNTFDHDKLTGENRFVSGPAGLQPGAIFHPGGTVTKVGGGGVARSAAAAAVRRYIELNPGASPQDISDFAASFKTTQVAGAGAARADQAELTQLRKMQGNVHTFIGAPSQGDKPSTGAYGEADLVKSLMSKGLAHLPGPLGGPAFQKLWNDARAGMGDPNIIALRNALLSLQQENAKIMQGSTGSVAAVSDQMSKEIESMLSGNFNADQLNTAIATMEKGWANRKAGIDQQVNAVESRLRNRRPGGAVGNSRGQGKTSARERSDAYLRAHDTPQMRAFYDERYGAGAAEALLAGQ